MLPPTTKFPLVFPLLVLLGISAQYNVLLTLDVKQLRSRGPPGTNGRRALLDVTEAPPFTSFQVPLPDLVRAYETNIACTDGLIPADQVVNTTADLLVGAGRNIPKTIHVTGKTKCVTQAFHDNLKYWVSQMPGYSFYFHDDQAVETLFRSQSWPLFPQIQNSFECLRGAGGAAMSDLWRYLVLFQYGGVYADMDTRPNTLFNATTITPDMDGFFLIEDQFKILSQYFFAIGPQHPLMFHAIQDVMQRMHAQVEVGTFNVPVESGPHCLHRAYKAFRGIHDGKNGPWKPTHQPKAGVYYYHDFKEETSNNSSSNRSITVVGNASTPDQWVIREAFKAQDKNSAWDKMNVSNYRHMNKKPLEKSCLDLLWEKQHQPEFVRTG
ncbi:glycosyltransferase [Seminavis robusta]|uniref:Glycosyltransferase n=1 Tax=Seminavis robusta TaxID=568900 RepID=A0A9N8DCA8_9STRA|nr:glycosyltransferase [Seminavis robusta]|eukprot:Sro32_g020880.1 glycosyltransferase (381) ;mRNA; f:101243-102589